MDKNEANNDDLVKTFDSTKFSFSPKMVAIILILIVVGIGGGYVFSKKSGPTVKGVPQTQITSSSQIKNGTILGSNDTKTFKDTAEGLVRAGGIDGEGQFHLERPGGDSQNVYLTSSTVDMSLIVGKKVKVWGQTQSAQHAGWLMDVGRVEVE